MTRCRTAITWSFVLLVSVMGMSCSSYKGFELVATTAPPTDVSVSETSIILPQGIAVGALLLASGAEDKETGEVLVSIRSSNPSVINISPTVEQNVFVLYGVSPGTAVLTVDVEGQHNETIPATVKDSTAISNDASDADAQTDS